MKNRFLLLMLFVVTSIASWGYGDGDYIRSVKQDGNGFVFKILSAADKTLVVWECSLTNDIVIPYEVIDSIGTHFYVKNAGIANDQHRVYKNTIGGTMTLSEGIETIGNDCFRTNYITKFIFPSTLKTISDYRLTQTGQKLQSFIVPDENPYFKTQGDTLLIGKTNGILYFATTFRTDETKRTIIDVPEGVVSIRRMAFGGNTSLTHIKFPSTLETLSNEVYLSSGCNYISFFEVHPDNPNLKSIDGVVYSKDGKTLVRVPYRLKNSNFDNEHCQKGQFGNYEIMDGVEKIGKWAFFQATLGSVTIPNSTTTIETDAFRECPRLTSINLGSGVTSIASTALSGCANLVAINVETGNPNYASDDGVLFSKDMTKLLTCPGGKTGSFRCPDATLYIEPGGFKGSKLSSIDFNNVIELKTNAILETKNLTEIYLGPNIEKIGSGCFSNSGNVAYQKVRIGNKLKTLSSTFANDHGLKEIIFDEGCQLTHLPTNCFISGIYTTVTIPRSIQTLGSTVFQKNLTELMFESGSELKALNKDALSNLEKLEVLDISGCTQFTTIGENAFRNMVSLRNISIPTSVTSIGKSAFSGCTSLTNVDFGINSSIKTIGANAFQNTGLETITLPDHLQSLQNEAFTNCWKLQTVNIPATTTSIGAQAFLFCGGLKEIIVHDDNTKYATSDGMLCSKNKKTLLSFPAGKARNSFTLLSPSFEEIGDSAFFYCKKLTNITIPKKVTSIGKYAFYLCDNLNSITFFTDEPVENLGTNVFGTANTDAGGNLVTVDGPTFLRNNVTINIRKNGHESEYSAAESVWKDCQKAYSFNSGVNEFLPMSATTVNLLNCTSGDNSVVIPASVTDAETSKNYSVGMISDYAFESIPSTVKEVIFRGPVEYVGSCAFYDKNTGTSPIKNIFFVDNSVGTNELSTARFGLGTEYKEFLSTQHIYVTRSMESNYKSNWPDFADQITYEIPTTDIMPNAECGSFAREFAVDLSNDGTNKASSPQLIAFVPMRLNSHDEDGKTVYTVRMQSINEGGAGDGTYIPAGTGVVLRKYGSSQPTYYEIAESQTNGNNAMSPAVICNSGQIPASTSTLWNYYIGKNDGLAHKATRDTSIGVHKSYLSIPVAAGAKAVTFSFSDIEDNATGVSLTKHESAEEGEWYTVTGQKTRRPSAGLFIRNGKKFIVK